MYNWECTEMDANEPIRLRDSWFQSTVTGTHRTFQSNCTQTTVDSDTDEQRTLSSLEHSDLDTSRTANAENRITCHQGFEARNRGCIRDTNNDYNSGTSYYRFGDSAHIYFKSFR